MAAHYVLNWLIMFTFMSPERLRNKNVYSHESVHFILYI